MKMKSIFNKKILIAIATISSLSLQSCLDDDDNYAMRFPNALVTVKTDAEQTVFLQLDDKTTLLPTNMTKSPYGEKEVRALVNYKEVSYERGRKMCEKLKNEIPRQLFEIPIQAAVGGKVIARETVRAMRKDVLAKCYGGDISRKRKLLEKQKEGKKRMRQFGNVEIPQQAFMSVLKLDEE